MMISTKGRYALRVMIDIAEHQHDGYIPLKEIAARQEISEKYLEAIVKSLVKERYLTGPRWPAWSRTPWSAAAWPSAAPCRCGAS